MWSLHFSNPKNRYTKGFSPYTGLFLTDGLSDELVSRPALLFVGDLGFFLRPCDFFFEYTIGDFAVTVFFFFCAGDFILKPPPVLLGFDFAGDLDVEGFTIFAMIEQSLDLCTRDLFFRFF